MMASTLATESPIPDKSAYELLFGRLPGFFTPGRVARHVASLVLPRAATSAHAARRFADSTLEAWRLVAVRDSAELVVSELASNAVRHAFGPCITVLLAEADGWVRLGVADESVALPREMDFTDDAESGRGLMIVSMLTARWSTITAPFGKVVWAEFDTAA